LDEIIEVVINKISIQDLKKTELPMQDIAAIEFMLKDEYESKIVKANSLIL